MDKSQLQWSCIPEAYVCLDEPVFRLTLGEHVPAQDSHNWGNMTGLMGHMGFVDFQFHVMPFRSDDDQYSCMRVLVANVEPLYQGKGLFTSMLDVVEDIAREKRVECIMYNSVQHPRAIHWMKKRKLDRSLYGDYVKWVY